MATLKQAEAAREQFADDLAQRGAHAVGVEQDQASSEWVVVAYVEAGARFDAPANLSARYRGKQLEVPLLVQRADAFKPE